MHHHTSSMDITPNLVKLCVVSSARKVSPWISRLNWHCTLAGSGPSSLQQQLEERTTGGSNLQFCTGLSPSTRLLTPSKGAFMFFYLLLGVKMHPEDVWNISVVPYSRYFPHTHHTKLFWCIRYGWTGYARA